MAEVEEKAVNTGNEKLDMYLNKIKGIIKRGEYDKYMTIPFFNKKLLFGAIKHKVTNKVETGGTPILNDAEIMECVNIAKETAVEIARLFIGEGFLEKTVDVYEVSGKGQMAIKNAIVVQ